MARFRIKHLVSGGIITNYFCTSKCRHCLYNCGPLRERKYMDTETAEDHFQGVHFMGCHSYYIGGGEPLLRPDNLADILGVAEKF
jgi:MoaA/NifB/PqqE/SkfB family radical SAM enzyme